MPFSPLTETEFSRVYKRSAKEKAVKLGLLPRVLCWTVLLIGTGAAPPGPPKASEVRVSQSQ